MYDSQLYKDVNFNVPEGEDRGTEKTSMEPKVSIDNSTPSWNVMSFAQDLKNKIPSWGTP